ncbi:hypothetical protein OG474_22655 [Kribbella sp. NBC_01505]|uniref:hypothetical protein n=1 Tax=Kribbella sp. NBC_01505 TaxID=2903580 RepID=UPI003868EFB9
MRKLMAAVGAVIIGGSLLMTSSVANAAGCEHGLKYRVTGKASTHRGIYELPNLVSADWYANGGDAVKGPGGSTGGATPVTQYWKNNTEGWVPLKSISTGDDVDWMASVFLDYLGCASA